MKHLRKPDENIRMPFIPLNIGSNQMFLIGAQPKVGRTLYSLHLIQDNSLKNNHSKCLAYFAASSKETLKQSGFGALMLNNKNVKFNFINSAGRSFWFKNIKNDIEEFKPDYILISGFERFFVGDITEGQLQNEVDKMLHDLRSLSDEKQIPIVLTTKILLEGEHKTAAPRPLLCDFDSGVLELINADYVCGLHSPFYDGDTESVEGENPWAILHIYELNPFVMVIKNTAFEIDKEAGRFNTKVNA